jgi:hypothetical protein
MDEVPVTYNQTEVFVDPIRLVIKKTEGSPRRRIVLGFSDGLRRTIPTGQKKYVQACNKILDLIYEELYLIN